MNFRKWLEDCGPDFARSNSIDPFAANVNSKLSANDSEQKRSSNNKQSPRTTNPEELYGKRAPVIRPESLNMKKNMKRK